MADNSKIETVIGPGSKIDGEVTGKSSIELYGTIEGKVRIDGLFWVRPEGKLVGEVEAKSVVVEGTVEGKIAAADKVELRSTCRSKGNVVADAVAIADGCFFEGHIQMRRGKS